MVIPTVDTELKLLAAAKSDFLESGIHVIVSSEAFIKTCGNKRETIAFFNSRGIDTPPIIDPDSPKFPFFVRPISGSNSKNVFKVNDASQVSPQFDDTSRFLLQEYVGGEGVNEYSLDLYYDRNSVLKCIVPRRRVAIRGGEMSKGKACKNQLIPFVREKLDTIPGAVGCLTLQVFLNSNTNQIFGIEINPRFGGGFPLSYFAGAQYPQWLLSEYLLNQKIEYFDQWKEDTVLLRYDNEMII